MSNRVTRALALLRDALSSSRRHDKHKRAKRIKEGIDVLTPEKHDPPSKPEPATQTVYPAIAAARKQSHDGPAFGKDQCMMRVRMCYGIAAGGDFDGDGDSDAWDGWERAKLKHRTTDPRSIPRGFPVFWKGGSHGNGHVAISAGDGMCWSTDIVRTGFFDYVPIAQIHNEWGLTLVGWAGDLNGVPIVPKVTK